MARWKGLAIPDQQGRPREAHQQQLFACQVLTSFVTSSDNTLYLMDGHNCAADDYTCAAVMTEVWVSITAGST